MKQKFLCPSCRSVMELPLCPFCNYEVPSVGTIYHLCDDPGIMLDGEDKYIGYDNIGEDFEPQTALSSPDSPEKYGVYEALGELIAKLYGTNITVLDLGAGLGTASLPLAKEDILTIAADISEVMLRTAEKRAGGRYENLILAKMNAYDLMLPDGSVDIVVENAMLHLVDNPEKIIREIVRVLKPGGKLIRYGSYGLPMSDEEWEKNRFCAAVTEDISDRYYEYLTRAGYTPLWFDNHFTDILPRYFGEPETVTAPGFSEIFTDKLKYRLHRLRTGAHSDLQHISSDVLRGAWEHAHRYAREKYGDSYADIKGFSRYGASLSVYTPII